MGVVNLFCAPASKPRGVAEDVAASVSLSFIHPLMTSAEDSQRGAVTKPHTLEVMVVENIFVLKTSDPVSG